jgi:hypothetical protein
VTGRREIRPEGAVAKVGPESLPAQPGEPPVGSVWARTFVAAASDNSSRKKIHEKNEYEKEK